MEERNDTRKIQFTGKSSYIISLPKQWILDLGLKQGDPINVVRQGASTLQISPTQYNTRTLQIEDATFEVESDDDNISIVRRLISLYFLGFKTINVIPKTGRFKPDQRTAVKDAVKKMLMGTEIISDSTEGITIQVLVNLLELSVNGAFKRMIHLAKSMLSDALLAVKESNFERAGDHAVIIAQDLLEFKKPIKKEILSKIQEMNGFALSFLDDACLALFKEDFVQAEKIIQKSTEITKYEKKVLDATKSLKDDEEIFIVRRMIENIRRIAEYASDITEIVLNMNVEKILQKPKT